MTDNHDAFQDAIDSAEPPAPAVRTNPVFDHEMTSFDGEAKAVAG